MSFLWKRWPVSVVTFFCALNFAAAKGEWAGHHIIFIGGHRGQQIEGYFSENVRIAKQRGAQQVTVILPPSEIPISETIPWLGNEIYLSWINGGRIPLVLIAHSRGSLETFHAILRRSNDFPESVLSVIILTQGLLKGSKLADIATRFDLMNILNPSGRVFDEGDRSLRTKKIADEIARTESLIDPDHLESLSRRTIYVRSSQSMRKVSQPLKLAASALVMDGENDGAVLTEYQKIDHLAGQDHFGKDLGPFPNRDHFDYVVDDGSPERRETIKEFMDLVGQEIKLLRPLNSRSLRCRNLFLK